MCGQFGSTSCYLGHPQFNLCPEKESFQTVDFVIFFCKPGKCQDTNLILWRIELIYIIGKIFSYFTDFSVLSLQKNTRRTSVLNMATHMANPRSITPRQLLIIFSFNLFFCVFSFNAV
jgi:hypothetical protein